MVNKENKKIAKVIEKSIKYINKSICENKKYFGRFIIRDCFYFINLTKQRGLLDEYFFEFVDKETKEKKFFRVKTTKICKDFSMDSFVEKIKKQIKSFLSVASIEWEISYKKNKVKNYKKIKID